jgi:hypothetical protein
MLPFIVAAQLLAADPAPGPSPLQDLIARAADRNRAAPVSLREYRAQMESEIAVLMRRADGEESALSMEQSQNEVHWRRGGEFSQHMTGYRARLSGPSMSALAVLRKAWAIPMLYGNEFGVIFGGDSKRQSTDKSAAAASTGSAVAVHPFGPDGESVYVFSGGDTVAVIETQQRRIPVVRVKVDPRSEQTIWPVVTFRGEIDLDADRGEIIRMRGQFVTLDRRGPQKKRLLIVPVSVMAYVDLESVEVDGRYWLPRYQRIETHVDIAGLAEGRSVFRIVSRFRGHEVRANDGILQTVTAFGAIAGADDAAYGTPRHRLSMARGDSLRRPRPWWMPLGEATAELRGDDFADVGAESSTPPRTPRLTWRAQRLAELVHFNRVEGWATGATARFTPGAAAPNILLRANATWAWSEQAMRGRVEARRRDPDGNWRAGVRIGRTLDITNDFTAPRDSGGALFAPLVGVDDYDYVDRRSAMLWFDRNLIPRLATLRLELTTAMDRGARAHLTSGPLGGDVLFRPNRGVDEGSFVSSAMVAEWNPAVNGAALATGVGAMLRTEVANGDLNWHRTTVRMNARADAGAMGYALRVDAGILTSHNAPPQQLFELGGGPAFPGYEYKEFAGDRAVAAHARALYRLPVLRSPLRIFGCTCLSSPAPELAFTLHGASLSASSAATRESMARLGSVPDSVGVTLVPLGRGAPLSRTTNGVRSSVEVGLRFFGGAATVALARPTDTGGPWRTVVLLGQPW